MRRRDYDAFVALVRDRSGCTPGPGSIPVFACVSRIPSFRDVVDLHDWMILLVRGAGLRAVSFSGVQVGARR